MEAEFDRPWWQHARGARYKRLTLDAYAGDGVGDDALANNCAKILDNLLRQDLGINAGSCFNHAVRAANGVLPQSVVQGIDYVRQQRNDVMHTLGVFCLQDPDRFVSCVNTALDAIERAGAAKRGGKPGVSGDTAPARRGGSLASGSGRHSSERRDQQEQQQLGQRQQQRQSQQRYAARLAAEAVEADAAAAEAAASRREAEQQQREAAELLAAEEASIRCAEQQWIEEAEFESQLAAALQASLQQEQAQQQQQQQQPQVAASSAQPGVQASAAQQQRGQQQGQTPLGQAVVDLTADSDGPPAKRRRCSEMGAGLEGRPCWLAGSPCEVIVISSQR